MKVIADEQITGVRAFGTIGDLEVLPAEEITARSVRSADILIVRSVTRIDDRLLKGSRIKIAGSVTSGIDHVDRSALAARGIRMVYAPGCNARAVAEYVLSCLLTTARIKNIELTGRTIGIIGVGHVGSIVARLCAIMGMIPMLNDPPLAERFGGKKNPYRSLNRVLKHADIITLHVPLTRTGRHATYHMADDRFFAGMKEKVSFINTSRGAVVDEKAMVRAGRQGRINGLILDVFEREPSIDGNVLSVSDIATPHIAGYSKLGRLRGTIMVYHRICRALGIKGVAKCFPLGRLPPVPRKTLSLAGRGKTAEALLSECVRKIYNPLSDDRKLRKYLEIPRAERPRYFAHLRDSYRLRPEFGEIGIRCRQCAPSLRDKLNAMGFRVH